MGVDEGNLHVIEEVEIIMGNFKISQYIFPRCMLTSTR